MLLLGLVLLLGAFESLLGTTMPLTIVVLLGLGEDVLDIIVLGGVESLLVEFVTLLVTGGNLLGTIGLLRAVALLGGITV